VDRRTIGPDLSSGLILGMVSVPDALASGVLAGVNPLFALYAAQAAADDWIAQSSTTTGEPVP
jgi:MFS superfamily sulfate permease-like transporter